MKTGIYSIKNKINGKCYIGSTSSSFYFRIRHHINALNRNSHSNIYLQNAWNKYGKNAFEFNIIEEAEPLNCLVREQYYIDNLKPEYNLCQIAGSRLGQNHSNETKVKMSIIKLGNKNPMFHKIGKLNRESKPIVINKNNQLYEFSCIKEGTEFIKMHPNYLSQILNGKRSGNRWKKKGVTIKFK